MGVSHLCRKIGPRAALSPQPQLHMRLSSLARDKYTNAILNLPGSLVPKIRSAGPLLRFRVDSQGLKKHW